MSSHAYGGLSKHYVNDRLLDSLESIIKSAKYGYGNYNIQDVIRTQNEYMAYYKDFWDLPKYASFKQSLLDKGEVPSAYKDDV